MSERDGHWFTDHEPSARWPHYTRANAGEVLPTPASPLGQTFVFDRAALPGMQEGACRMGSYEASEFRADVPDICGFFGAYFYNNLACIRMQAVRNPAITVEQLDLAFFGSRPDTPPYEEHPDDDKPELLPLAERHMAFVLSATTWPELLVERAHVAALRASRPDLRSLTDADLITRARAAQVAVRELARNHLVASGSCAIAPGMLGAVGHAIGDPALAVRVLASHGDVDSAAPSLALWDLSRLVRSSAELTAAFDAGVATVLDRLSSSASDDVAVFRAALDQFVYEYGSRGPNEWEISAPSWETDPRIVAAAIDRVRLQDDSKAPAARVERLTADREAVVAEARAELAELGNAELAGVFESALVAGNMMVFRERAKTNLVRAIHEIRVAALELGRRHADVGHLAAAQHVFMLRDTELDDFIARPATFRDLLAQRAADWAHLWTLEPPFFISHGVVPPLGEWASRRGSTVAAAVPGDVLVGVPGSPGTVTGRARIVTDAAEPPDLQPGDIMVAPLTDPAWTPLFLAVEAVVVDVGGQVSHAVIVCRELGLPCVVSVAGGTDRIPDGAVIEVDGRAGTVRILSIP